MAIPGIGSGLVLADSLTSSSFSAAAVGLVPGKAVVAVQPGELTLTRPGLNPAIDDAQVIDNSVATTSAGSVYTAASATFTPVDISSIQSALIMHFAGDPTAFNRVDNVHIFATNTGLTEWCRWDIGNSSDEFYAGPPNFFALLLHNSNISEQSIGFDSTAITNIAVGYEPTGTGSFGVFILLSRLLHLSGPVELVGGEIGTEASFSEYLSLLSPTGSNALRNAANNDTLPPASGFGIPIVVNSDNFNESDSALIFRPSNISAGFNPPSGYYSRSFVSQVGTDGIFLTNGFTASSSLDVPVIIDSSSGSTIVFSRWQFLNTSDLTVNGFATFLDSCSIPTAQSVNLSDGLVSLEVGYSFTPVNVNTVLTPGSSISVGPILGSAIRINTEPFDHSQTTFTVFQNDIIEINGTVTGTYDLSSLVVSGGGTVTINTLGPSVTVIVPAGTAIGGPGVTIQVPPEIAGIDAINLPEGLALIRNVTTATDIVELSVPDGAGLQYQWNNGTDFTAGDVGYIRWIGSGYYDFQIDFIATQDTAQELLNTPEVNNVIPYFKTVTGIPDYTLITEFSAATVPGRDTDVVINEFFDPPNQNYSVMRLAIWLDGVRPNAPGLNIIQSFWGGISAVSESSVVLNDSNVDGYLDLNLTSGLTDSIDYLEENVSLTTTSGRRIERDTSSGDTTSGGCIGVNRASSLIVRDSEKLQTIMVVGSSCGELAIASQAAEIAEEICGELNGE